MDGTRGEGEVRTSVPDVEALARASRAIAHDLRNVFSVINTSAVDLYDEMYGRQAASLVLEILNAAERGLIATTELLQAGRSPGVELRPIDMCRQTADLEPILRRLASAGVTLEVRCDGVATYARVDRTSLMQVLMNLVANASDAMGHEGEIRVACGRRVRTLPDGSEIDVVTLAVTDSGPGLHPDVLARMFDDGFSTKEGTHWGLGLSVVRRVVERCHGWIGVSSSAGRGTTVEIQFPSVEPERSGVALLVVADDGARSRLAGALAAESLFVVVAADAMEACDVVVNQPIPDIVVVDTAAAVDRGLWHMARLDLVFRTIAVGTRTVPLPATSDDALTLVRSCTGATLVSPIAQRDRLSPLSS